MSPAVSDVTIIGAGPTGLFAAFYAGLRNLSTTIVESLPEPGGQLAVLYPEKFIYDVPGHPKILAQDLVHALVQQTSLFQPTFALGERAEDLRQVVVEGEQVWCVHTDIQQHYSRAVIITAGVGAFAPNKLDAEGVDDFGGRGVFYFVKDKRPLRGRRVLIVGGGDTAVDWSLNLKDWSKQITLIHRRNEFRAHESSVAALRASDVTVLTPYELKRVYGGEGVRGAVIFDNRTGEERDLDVDTVLINVGFKAALGPIAQWGLDLADNRHIRVDGAMATNLPGVFAAGDVAAAAGTEPLSLIVTGFAQAAVAANAAAQFLDPKARLFPGHSSELKL